jgi:FtsP/CotA-like multicopper oxidase with cupredoxin domain
MATIDIWIQLENHPWDICPNGIDRMTGETFTSVGKWNGRDMFKPLSSSADKPLGEDALIYRRYKPPVRADKSDAWTVPDDRKVNPWDLNEPDPTDTGTKGTIPGPVIECSIGDTVLVHFRNMDMRSTLTLTSEKICFPFPFGEEICFNLPHFKTEFFDIKKRCHSMHTHGFVFAQSSDGAYPLATPDSGQPVTGGAGVPDETALWTMIPENNTSGHFDGLFKKGDRVPPGGTFTYSWNTIGWPTTSGVWLYHDHSISDVENVSLGAIGIVVIHNPAEPGDIDIRIPGDLNNTPDPAFLPAGILNASPADIFCFPFILENFPFKKIPVLPHQLEGIKMLEIMPLDQMPMTSKKKTKGKMSLKAQPKKLAETIPTVQIGNSLWQLDKELKFFIRRCSSHFRTPPAKAIYLQLFHYLAGGPGMCINGRTYLGNTPTMIGGPATKMRFGVVGMGDDFHTFHIHGHRWVIPGNASVIPATGQPNPANLQFGGPMNSPVSQFEDTKIFGPANSFAFTIDEGNGFMRASPPQGEWHMHCHVLGHMMSQGMMGSLLIVNGGEPAPPFSPLPTGVSMDDTAMPGMGGGTPLTATVRSANSATGLIWKDDVSGTGETTIKVGGTVNWVGGVGGTHTILSTNPPAKWAELAVPGSLSAPFTTVGNYEYVCGIHGGDVASRTGMWGIVHVVAA